MIKISVNNDNLITDRTSLRVHMLNMHAVRTV